jgi:hypothetical protein
VPSSQYRRTWPGKDFDSIVELTFTYHPRLKDSLTEAEMKEAITEEKQATQLKKKEKTAKSKSIHCCKSDDDAAVDDDGAVSDDDYNDDGTRWAETAELRMSMWGEISVAMDKEGFQEKGRLRKR